MTRLALTQVRHVEGVPYYPFEVRFRLADGRRRRWVRWSPGYPWVRGEITRELAARFNDRELPTGSTVRIVDLRGDD